MFVDGLIALGQALGDALEGRAVTDHVDGEVQFRVLDEASGQLTCGSCGPDVDEGQQTCGCGACFVGDLASEPAETVYGDFRSFYGVIE